MDNLILLVLFLILVAVGAFAGLVLYAPRLLPAWVRVPLKSYGIIKPGRARYRARL